MKFPVQQPELSLLFGAPGELEARQKALRRFEAWERLHPSSMGSAQAIEAIGFLYELLPPSVRDRPIDVSGIALMHRRLRALDDFPG